MIFISVALLLLAYALYEYSWFKTVHLKMSDLSYKASSVEKKRLIFLSDLQYDHKRVGFRHHAARKLVRQVNALNPDLVILGGDIIHKKDKFNHLIFTYLDEINAEKIAIFGNHDFYDLGVVLGECERLGIRVLRNEVEMFEDIQIVGIEHPMDDDYTIPEWDKEPFTLLVSHGPDFIVDVGLQADFMLAGHLHGGQVTVFGCYAPITNSRYKQKYLHGLKTVEDSHLYVSSGLGGYVGFLPIRFFARPEIVVLDF